LATTSLFCLICTIQHYYNTFFGHYFTISFILYHSTLLQYPFYGLYFTILFILYHSALLQYLNLVSTSLFCLFCGIQHYYNTLFWPLLHYFVYSVQFNITTTPFLASASLFCLFCSIHHYYNTFIWSLLHYFVYSVAFKKVL
jgi:hypothetical protein